MKPILFLVFNRPEPTRRVFEAIRAARPARLFVAADGPRPDRQDDAALCAETRRIATAIDWPCEVQTLFRDSNLGCKDAVSSGISWFFDQVEEGIILEDDCLPDQSFFPYCEELLARYRDDARVMMISGYDPVGDVGRAHDQVRASYLFSVYGAIWGWASWRRAWHTYSLDPAVWNDRSNRRMVRRALDSGWQWKIKKWSYEQAFSGRKNTWDYQWEYARLLHGGLSIMPSVNLIENIGFGADSTHTSGTNRLARTTRQIPYPLTHPTVVAPDRAYDSRFMEIVFGRETFFRKIARVIGFRSSPEQRS